MTKGFTLFLAVLVAGAYYLYQQDPTGKGRAGRLAGGGGLVEIAPGAFASEVMESAVPVVAYFWAPWCGPCRSVSPAVEELAGELGGRARVAKVNVDDCPEAAARMGIRSIPSILLIRGGQVVRQVSPGPGSEMLAQVEAGL